ncbi:MAG: hypothetical protein ACTSSF_06295 [Candidatus Heimdallarchaeaceae archaeon]
MKEIFKFYNEISYVAPYTIVKELSSQRDKVIFLQQHIDFTKSQIFPQKINKLKEFNEKTHPHCFEREETGDYEIIQTAIDNKTKNLIPIIVSNDEGIHNFVQQVLSDLGIKAIWGHSFLLFLSRQASEESSRQLFSKAANLQKSYVEDYRKKYYRGIIEEGDFDKILAKTLTTIDYSTDIKLSFEQMIKDKECTKELPTHLEKIANFFTSMFSYLDLNDTNLAEQELRKLEEFVYSLRSTDREEINCLIAPHKISFLLNLASIYDQKNEITGVISALERASSNLTYTGDKERREQVYSLLSWIHLLCGSNSLARFYFDKTEKKQTFFWKKTDILFNLLLLDEEQLDETIMEQLPEEEWNNLTKIINISWNQKLQHKLKTLLERVERKTVFALDARHFRIKDELIETTSLLNFLQKDFLVIKIIRKGDKIVLNCVNSLLGEFNFVFPLIETLQGLTKGDVISLNNGRVERISKPQPGSKMKGTVYFKETEELDLCKKQFKKFI